MLFHRLLHENDAVPKFTSCYGKTQKMLSTILDRKNAKRVQNVFFKKNNTKDKMTHFNISLTVKILKLYLQLGLIINFLNPTFKSCYGSSSL